MIVLGIDPDTNNTGYALLEEGDEGVKVLVCGVVDTRSTKGILAVEKTAEGLRDALAKLPPADLVIAEYPVHYNGGPGVRHGRPNKVNPNSLVMLAAVSGAAVGAANLKEGGKSALARPAVWKGQQSKGANQRQSCRIIGWKFKVTSNYSIALTEVTPHKDTVVNEWKGRSKKPWSEILDAVGIALYGLNKYGGSMCHEHEGV